MRLGCIRCKTGEAFVQDYRVQRCDRKWEMVRGVAVPMTAKSGWIEGWRGTVTLTTVAER